MFRNLLLLLGIYFLWRFATRLIRRVVQGSARPDREHTDGAEDQAYENLTRQDISDADYEELDDEKP